MSEIDWSATDAEGKPVYAYIACCGGVSQALPAGHVVRHRADCAQRHTVIELAALALLKELEWIDHHAEPWCDRCPVCDGGRPGGATRNAGHVEGHAGGCRLAILLNAPRRED